MLTSLKYRLANKLDGHFTIQCICAIATTFILALILGKDKVVAISSIGATAFILFATPKKVSAQTMHIIGGYAIGLTSGLIFSTMSLHFAIAYPLLIGTVFFLMVVFNIQHAPAVGAALAVVTNEVTALDIAAIVFSIVILSQCRYYIRHQLRNLV